MADMTIEMKYNQLKQQRTNEPSLSGMFMGANALMCKPMDSFLPIIAAWTLYQAGFSSNLNPLLGVNDMNEILDHPASDTRKIEWTLFYLMIGPSLIFSPLQFYIWRNYDLDDVRKVTARPSTYVR